MDIIRLRTLTRKSTLGFGKLADMPIQAIIDTKNSVYLRWVYYNIEGITFTADILDEICIREENRIEKPGTDPIMHPIVNALIQSTFSKLKEYHTNKYSRKKRNITLARKNHSRVKTYYKKSVLQNRNRHII
jgi:hypothetical protein